MEQTFSINFKAVPPTERAKPESEEQALLDQANGFFQAGSRCDADLSLSPNVTNNLPAPATVCYAFAIELFLKLLLRISGVGAKKVHDLAELFALLPDEIRTAAAAQYQRVGAVAEDQLLKEITASSKAFNDWRYLHEVPFASVSTSVLRQIGKALHNTVRQLRPEIGVTFENRLVLPPGWKP